MNYPIRQDGETALMNAAFFGKPDVAELLLAYGADTTRIATGGVTALSIARQRKHTKIVTILEVRRPNPRTSLRICGPFLCFLCVYLYF